MKDETTAFPKGDARESAPPPAIGLLFDDLPFDRHPRARGRPRKLTPMEEVAIAEARESGVPWKVLERLYGMARSKLAAAQDRGEKIIKGHISCGQSGNHAQLS